MTKPYVDMHEQFHKHESAQGKTIFKIKYIYKILGIKELLCTTLLCAVQSVNSLTVHGVFDMGWPLAMLLLLLLVS